MAAWRPVDARYGRGVTGQEIVKGQGKGIEIGPTEDLMREHGLLRRVLLIYDEVAGRLEGNKDLPSSAVVDSATIVRDFVENYHERLEEDFVFPRFRKADQHQALVDSLQAQHDAGRALTGRIMVLSTESALRNEPNRRQLVEYLRAFCRMYRPHAAREDTVLFPAFLTIVTHNEYKALGERFEGKESELLGKNGFEGMLAGVERIEKLLGIYDLSLFTPNV